MGSIEKEVVYTTTNSYSTLNTLTDKTKNVWFICHGIGYLSRYFLASFYGLNKEENYIIAPQAQSKYYLNSQYKHVGASWLTQENTAKEIENVMRYFDAVLEEERLPEDCNLIMFGFSQGVSVVTRYVAKRKLKCNQLILLAGGIPKELSHTDFKFLEGYTKVSFVYGTQDEYINKKVMEVERERIYTLFGNSIVIKTFEGKHEIKREVIQSLV